MGMMAKVAENMRRVPRAAEPRHRPVQCSAMQCSAMQCEATTAAKPEFGQRQLSLPTECSGGRDRRPWPAQHGQLLTSAGNIIILLAFYCT
jgi:hypothetical protein